MFSRIGIKREIKGNGRPQEDADMLVRLTWPEALGKLGTLPVQVVKERGHLRALRKQLLLARDIATAFESPAEAFKAAHTQLVRDYALED
jgi:hypothetical protein